MANATIPLTATVQVSAQQVSTELDGEMAILSLENGVYYGLDPVGARIWELLQEPQAVTAVRDRIVAEYEVSPEVCEADLLALLGDLRAAGLVEVRDV
ncbi:MAG TPA: PqqD family peptide modification chaperone [Thermomicrobiales bacterium]|jgi:hypothetical protein